MMLTNPIPTIHQQTLNHSPLMQDKTPEKMVCGIILNNWKSRHNTKLLMRKALQHTDNSSIFKTTDGSSCLGIQKKKKTSENKAKFKFHQYQAPIGESFYSSSLVDVKKPTQNPYETKQTVNNKSSPYIEKQVVFKFATLPHQTAHTSHVKSVTTSPTMFNSTCCSASSTSIQSGSSTNSSNSLRSNQLIMDDDFNNHYQRDVNYTTNINNNVTLNRWSSFELPQINCHQATTISEPLPSFSQLINTLGI